MRNVLHSIKTILGGEAHPQSHSNAESVNATPILPAVTLTPLSIQSLTARVGVCA